MTDTAVKRRMAAGFLGNPGVTPDLDTPRSWRLAAGYSYNVFSVTALDTAFKRRMAAGLPLPAMFAITPDATPGKEWRKSSGWSYHFDDPTVFYDLGEATFIITLDMEADDISATSPHVQNLVIGVGSGAGGGSWDGKFKAPKFGKGLNMPLLPGMRPPRATAPRARQHPEIDKLQPQPTEAELTEERWRRWQESPAAAGKGSASILEFMVWEFLVQKKRQIEGVDFIYQYPLAGGRTQFGGFVADFYFPHRQEVWNPAGMQFHWTKSKHRARDIMARAVLASRGIKLIYLWEDDMMNRPAYVLEQAWQGNELFKI
jgi:very-short-patch-repair endonuclease